MRSEQSRALPLSKSAQYGAPRHILEAGIAARLPGFLAADTTRPRSTSLPGEPVAVAVLNNDGEGEVDRTTRAAAVRSKALDEGCATHARRRQVNFQLRGTARKIAPKMPGLQDRAHVSTVEPGHAAAVQDPLRGTSGERQSVAFECRPAVANRKGFFARQVEARENAMIASLAKLGLADMVSAKVERMHVAGCKLDQRASAALESMQDGQHEWRSKWSFFRPTPNFEENQRKRRVIDAFHFMTRKAKTIRRQQERGKWEMNLEAELAGVHATVQALDLWNLRVGMPMKKPDYVRVIDVDSTCTLQYLKQLICDFEGFHPSQQILHVKSGVSSPKQNTQQNRGSVPKHLHKRMHTRLFPPTPVIEMHRIDGGEEATLGELRITTDSFLELEIDRAVGKIFHRKMLMQEIGLDGATFRRKTEEAFNHFDLDEVRNFACGWFETLFLLRIIHPSSRDPQAAELCFHLTASVYLNSIW
jgi:hypothetical protein